MISKKKHFPQRLFSVPIIDRFRKKYRKVVIPAQKDLRLIDGKSTEESVLVNIPVKIKNTPKTFLTLRSFASHKLLSTDNVLQEEKLLKPAQDLTSFGIIESRGRSSRSVSDQISSVSPQSDIERLTAENTRLRKQVKDLEDRLKYVMDKSENIEQVVSEYQAQLAKCFKLMENNITK